MDWLQFCNGKFSLTGLHGNHQTVLLAGLVYGLVTVL